jgi:hypothetical protein
MGGWQVWFTQSSDWGFSPSTLLKDGSVEANPLGSPSAAA